MTAQELEKLLAEVTPGEWEWSPRGEWGGTWLFSGADAVVDYAGCGSHDCTVSYSDARLIAIAPTLARRVIAAEKLIEALSLIADGHSWQRDIATDALAEWESAQ